MLTINKRGLPQTINITLYNTTELTMIPSARRTLGTSPTVWRLGLYSFMGYSFMGYNHMGSSFMGSGFMGSGFMGEGVARRLQFLLGISTALLNRPIFIGLGLDRIVNWLLGSLVK